MGLYPDDFLPLPKEHQNDMRGEQCLIGKVCSEAPMKKVRRPRVSGLSSSAKR
jgi:hypothetical protein